MGHSRIMEDRSAEGEVDYRSLDQEALKGKNIICWPKDNSRDMFAKTVASFALVVEFP